MKFHQVALPLLLCSSFTLLYPCLGFAEEPQSTSGAAPAYVDLPVQKGEDLLGALNRVNPCVRLPTTDIPSEIFADNPEHAGPTGRMLLKNSTLHVPASFMANAKQCPPAPAANAAHPGLEAGGIETAAIHAEPTGLIPNPHHPAGDLAPEHGASGSTAPEHASTDLADAAAEHGAPHAAVSEHTAQHEHPHSGPEFKNKLALTGFLNFSKLSPTVFGNGLQTALTSKAQPGFELEYERELSHRWAAAISYRQTQTAYQEIEGLEFNELSTTMRETALTLSYQITEATHFSLRGGAAQVDELSLDPDSKLLIDHSWRAIAGFNLAQQLTHFSGFELEGSLGTTLFIPTDSSASVGSAETLKLAIARHLSHRFSLEAGVETALERQTTQAETHSVFGVTFSLGLGFHF
jgi:hypothetical protein